MNVRHDNGVTVTEPSIATQHQENIAPTCRQARTSRWLATVWEPCTHFHRNRITHVYYFAQKKLWTQL
jgi:hypothetical protein